MLCINNNNNNDNRHHHRHHNDNNNNINNLLEYVYSAYVLYKSVDTADDPSSKFIWVLSIFWKEQCCSLFDICIFANWIDFRCMIDVADTNKTFLKKMVGKKKWTALKNYPIWAHSWGVQLFGIRCKPRSSNETRKTKHYRGPTIRSLSRVGLGLVLVTQGDF